MGKFVLRRLLISIPQLAGVTVLVFLMLHAAPGDPARLLLGNRTASLEMIEATRHDLGLDLPLPVQYGRYLRGVLRGDFGRSIYTQQPVGDAIVRALPPTLELALVGLVVGLSVGVGLGVLAASFATSWVDKVAMVIGLLGVSIPGFWLGILLIYVFALQLGWLPSIGEGSPAQLVLPSFALGIHVAGVISRMTRSAMLEVLHQEYITVAYAKGLRRLAVTHRHALKNALIPVVTVTGLQFGYLLGGAVVIEAVFARPGIGSLMVQAVHRKDFPVVQATVLLLVVVYILINLAVDVIYVFLDPRIRYS